jgi:hypothetical protein
MIIQNRVLGRAFLALALVSAAAARADGTRVDSALVERYEGVARDKNGAIVYREKHEVEYRGGRIHKAFSRYVAADGRELAILESEFPGGVSLPKYRFRNLVANFEEGVDCCKGNQLEVFHRGKRKVLTFAPNWVSGQGFHYLAREKLNQVDRGQNEEFQFLIPSKMTTYDFRIRSGGHDPKDPRRVKMLLEIDQWFFRLFAPKIIATYDLDTRRLMAYEGPSNLEDEKGNIPNVRIDYTYEKPAP